VRSFTSLLNDLPEYSQYHSVRFFFKHKGLFESKELEQNFRESPHAGSGVRHLPGVAFLKICCSKPTIRRQAGGAALAKWSTP
jgi:hypothetical protein